MSGTAEMERLREGPQAAARRAGRDGAPRTGGLRRVCERPMGHVAPRALVLVAMFAAACSGVSPEPGARRARAPDPATRRVLDSGPVVGFVADRGAYAWLGIPYARPPVGELRWRAPAPAVPWTGTREALDFGAPCPQLASPIGGVADAPPGTPVGSEDCLTLNVWSPAADPAALAEGGARLPVMVWIHGGGNVIGHAGQYDGSRLAAEHGVVVVSVHYRLGPLGWFRHPALRAGSSSPLDASGNFGTLDLIEALRWVSRNAAAFGGDPDNVTIFGESAGGTNVIMLLVSPLSEGLFHRAIVESGGTRTMPPEAGERYADGPEPGHRRSSAEVLLDLLVRDGLAPDRTSARERVAAMADDEIAGYLRGKAPEDLLALYAPEPPAVLSDVPRLFRDGVVLPSEPPEERLAMAGGYHAVPTILGTNRDETKLFMALDRRFVRRLFGLPWPRDRVRYAVLAEYQSDLWKATGADELAERMAAVQGPTVWVYRFDWDEEPRILWSDLSFLLGAAHGFEIPFVFGRFHLGRADRFLFTRENEPGRARLSTWMRGYWTTFARTGDPGRGGVEGAPRWEPWRPTPEAPPRFAVLDTPAGGGVRHLGAIVTVDSLLARLESDPRLADDAALRCEVWQALRRSERVPAERFAASGCPPDASASR